MPSVLVILAEGFEELEATAPATILRRAQIDVVMAGLAPGPVKGSRGVTIVPDATLESVADRPFDAVVVPGGIPGTANLKKSELVAQVLKRAVARSAIIGAICAGPSVLAAFGLLTGRCATSHTSVRDELLAAKVEIVPDQEVVEDGRIVTSRGAGTAVPFGLHLVRLLAGDAKLAEVRKGMMLG